MVTVYADVLVALNILLTYILIVASRVVCKIPANKWAVMVASIVGGISSLIIFYDNVGVVFSCLYKIITGAIIVGIAFLPKGLKSFLKVFFSFIKTMMGSMSEDLCGITTRFFIMKTIRSWSEMKSDSPMRSI